MPIKLTDAIVIRSIDYKENDRILTLFSPTDGKLTAAMRGVKKNNAKLKFASQLYNYGEYELSSIGGTVTGCKQYRGFFGVTEDIEAFYAAGVAAEVLCREEFDTHTDIKGIFGELLKLLTALEMKGDAFLAISLFLYYLGETEGFFPRRVQAAEDISDETADSLFWVKDALKRKSYGDTLKKESGKRILSALYRAYYRELGKIGSLDVLLTFR